MADPYAERARPAGPLPAGPPPWLGPVAERQGLVLTAGAGLPAPAPRFIVVAVSDTGVLPPIAWVGAEQALMLAVAAGAGGGALPAAADLDSLGVPLYAFKHGTVAGPTGSPGSFDVDGELIAAVLDAAEAGEVEWELDPDFGWRVAARVPGVGPPAAEALCPRLLYAAHDRVYEHADLVAETKQRWHERLGAAGDIPAELLAATGWPPEPTGKEWAEGLRRG